MISSFGVVLRGGEAAAATMNDPVSNIMPSRTMTKPDPIQFGLFGSYEFKVAPTRINANWRNLIKKVESERGKALDCDNGAPDCVPAYRRWRNQIEDARPFSKRAQLERLNRFANRLRGYRDDIENFGVHDYWASPLEFAKRGGDCEDFAIIKFFALLELGFTNEQIRLAVVRDTKRNILHAVVTVKLGQELLILDSNYNHVISHEYLMRYVPLYSLNLTSRWAHIVTPALQKSFVDAMIERKRRQFASADIPSFR